MTKEELESEAFIVDSNGGPIERVSGKVVLGEPCVALTDALAYGEAVRREALIECGVWKLIETTFSIECIECSVTDKAPASASAVLAAQEFTKRGWTVGDDGAMCRECKEQSHER